MPVMICVEPDELLVDCAGRVDAAGSAVVMGVCAAGTDTADCDSCRYANDGECDHGTFCNTGTDWSDCAPGLG